MKRKVRQKLEQSKRRMEGRLTWGEASGRSMLAAANVQYEIAERTRAISAGGVIPQMAKRLKQLSLIRSRKGNTAGSASGNPLLVAAR